MRGFVDVWRSLGHVWGNIATIRDISWSSINARKIRASFDAVLKEMDGLPPRIQQYEAYLHMRTTTKQGKAAMMIMTTLKGYLLQP